MIIIYIVPIIYIYTLVRIVTIESCRGLKMRRLVTAVNNEQYRIIENYCKNKGISIWKLLKDSVLERVGNKTLDDFVK